MERQDDKHLLYNVPSSAEFLAARIGDIVVADGGIGARSVSYKFYQRKDDRYYVQVLALRGQDNNEGEFWYAPDKAVNPDGYNEMLSITNSDTIFISEEVAVKALRKKFILDSHPGGSSDLTLIGMYIDHFTQKQHQ
ncbi:MULTISPECIES: hypothetical protein [Pseudomonas]|uniref:Uncharacterized protein n=2 Tax=Pseudomonas TaxID=286 RepID=A0ACC5MKG3_9PSED|nr:MULTISPECIES: hypothetical protein [Pseudomonas]ATE75354.1 hypothetical protein CNN82_02605 [Pseudomonas frederiksbergensis]MBB2889098.1 hypothetical protein [Pseudomonas umsongensis]NMN80273.1 hypothetical protein [Pseudomonas sp. KD5]CAH0319680.1 hypothetical protein SRABI123_05388 [Pseudomonas sp. Bi123]